MSISIPGRVVLFDYGEVISVSPSRQDRDELLTIAGVDPEPFWRAYDGHRDELDRGTLSVPQYWARIAEDVGAGWPLSTVHRMWTVDFRSWITVEPGTVDLIDRLHQGGTRIALLSNAGFDYSSPFRFSPMAQCFERMFVSAEMLSLKPDPEIYLEVARELAVEPEQLVFIDNKLVNVEGAAAVGMTAHHFTTADGLRAFLESLAA
ncbi:HAD family hydrolase [Lysobacter korlensis]|uniref:HAD family hydrolase n=1 Tax=Lysobacter korlensis TaxID=553636 RepID=A0ABV6RVT6_9GAMM